MKPPEKRLCRICGNPVTPKRKNTIKAWYYPKQCKDCFGKMANKQDWLQKISAAKKGFKSILAKPIGTRSIHYLNKDQKYWKIKTSEFKWVAEHRCLMENHIGRKLFKNEIVHHINGDTLDNRLENLEIMTRASHAICHQTIEKWSIKYDSCIICHSTSRKHLGHGLCSACYTRDRRKRYGRKKYPKRK